MKMIKPATKTHARRLLQEIYIDNIIRFLEEKYKDSLMIVPDEKKITLAKKWLEHDQVQEIVNTMNVKLVKFFENEFQDNEEDISNFLMAFAEEARQDRHREFYDDTGALKKKNPDKVVSFENISVDESRRSAEQIQYKEGKDIENKRKKSPSNNGMNKPSPEKNRKGPQIISNMKAYTLGKRPIKQINNPNQSLDHDDSLASVSNRKSNKLTAFSNNLQKPKNRKGHNGLSLTENLQNYSEKLDHIENFIAKWKDELEKKDPEELDQIGFSAVDFERAVRRREHIEEILQEISNKEVTDPMHFEAIRSEVWEIVEEYEQSLADQALQYKRNFNNYKQGAEDKIIILDKENKELLERIKALSNSEELEQKYEEVTIKLNETQTALDSLDMKHMLLINQMDHFKKIFQHIESNFVNLKRMATDIRVHRWSDVADPLRIELYQKNALNCYDYVEKLFWDDEVCTLIAAKTDPLNRPTVPPTADLIEHAIQNLELSKAALIKMNELAAIKPKEMQTTDTQAYEYEFNLINEVDLEYYKDILKRAHSIAVKNNHQDKIFHSLESVNDLQNYTLTITNDQVLSTINDINIQNPILASTNQLPVGKVALGLLQYYEGLLTKYISMKSTAQISMKSPMHDSGKLTLQDNVTKEAAQTQKNKELKANSSVPTIINNQEKNAKPARINPKSLLIAGIMKVMSRIWLKQESIPQQYMNYLFSNNPEAFSAGHFESFLKFSLQHNLHDESQQAYFYELSSKLRSQPNSTQDPNSSLGLSQNRRLAGVPNIESRSTLTKQSSFITTQNTNRDRALHTDREVIDEREINPLMAQIEERTEDHTYSKIISKKLKSGLLVDSFTQTDFNGIINKKSGYLNSTNEDENALDEIKTRNQHWKNILPEELFNPDISSSQEELGKKDITAMSPVLIRNDFMLGPINQHDSKDPNTKLNKTYNELTPQDKLKLPKIDRLQIIQRMRKGHPLKTSSQYLEILDNSNIQSDGKNRRHKTLEDIIYEQTKKTIIALNDYLEKSNSPTLRSPNSKSKDIEDATKAVEDLLKQKLLENKYDELLEYIRRDGKTAFNHETVSMTSRLIAQGKHDVLKKKIRSGIEWKRPINIMPQQPQIPQNPNGLPITEEINYPRMRMPIHKELYDRIGPQSKQSHHFKPYRDFFNSKYPNNSNSFHVKLLNNINPHNRSVYDINPNNIIMTENSYRDSNNNNNNASILKKKSDLKSIMNLNLHDLKSPLDPLTEKYEASKDSLSSIDNERSNYDQYNMRSVRDKFKQQDLHNKSVESDHMDLSNSLIVKKKDTSFRETDSASFSLPKQNGLSSTTYKKDYNRQEKKIGFKDLPKINKR